MTFEERFEALVEADRRLQQRHETLSQTVEILSGMQRDNERRFAEITHTFEIALDSIKRLERIAVAHERPDDLEG